MSCDPAIERMGQLSLLLFVAVLLLLLLLDPMKESMEEEWGTEGVEPEEHVREKASAHS